MVDGQLNLHLMGTYVPSLIYVALLRRAMGAQTVGVIKFPRYPSC